MANYNTTLLVILVAGIALWAGMVAVLVLPIQPFLSSSPSGPQGTPSATFTLYGGEISGSSYGFGLSPSNITSPGPTLNLKIGDVVKITLVNAGQVPHAFAVTAAPRSGANVLFNAEIASASQPLSPGGTGSVTFTITQNGTYYYICPVPGHAELGMWGAIIVG